MRITLDIVDHAHAQREKGYEYCSHQPRGRKAI